MLSAPHGSPAPLATDSLLPAAEATPRTTSRAAAWRLRSAAALDQAGPISWFDVARDVAVAAHGDVVIAAAISVHLSSVSGGG